MHCQQAALPYLQELLQSHYHQAALSRPPELFQSHCRQAALSQLQALLSRSMVLSVPPPCSERSLVLLIVPDWVHYLQLLAAWAVLQFLGPRSGVVV